MYSSKMVRVVCHLRRQRSFIAKWRNLLVHVLYMYYLYPKRMGCGGCVLIGPIIRVRDKKLQQAFNGLVKEFIWANLSFIESSSQIKPLKELEPTRKFKR